MDGVGQTAQSVLQWTGDAVAQRGCEADGDHVRGQPISGMQNVDPLGRTARCQRNRLI